MDEDVKTAWLFVALHDLHPGDEHPDRKGWFLQYERGPRDEPMWYRPPSRGGVWIQRAAWVIYVAIIGVGVAFAVILGV